LASRQRLKFAIGPYFLPQAHADDPVQIEIALGAMLGQFAQRFV
jgi:hypothetical protein